jgi:membrane carboxypeptidase/penicillin-binding protein
MKQFARLFELNNGQQVLFEVKNIEGEYGIVSTTYLDGYSVEVTTAYDTQEQAVTTLEGLSDINAAEYYNWAYEMLDEEDDDEEENRLP